MIHFLIEDTSRQRRTIAGAMFELGCRLNTHFTVHFSTSSLPSEGTVVRYGGDGRPGDVRMNVAHHNAQGRVHDVEGLNVWALDGPNGPDIIAGASALCNFEHENPSNETKPDTMGRLPAKQHPLVVADAIREPLLENNARLLRTLLEKSGAPVPQVSTPWGTGRYAVCISHDVDGPQLHAPFALFRSALYALRGDRHEYESLELGLLTRLTSRPDPYWNFDGWQRLERSMGARSSFYVYPGGFRDAPRHARDPHYDPHKAPFPEALRRLAADGWEIGPHIGIRGHSEGAYREAISRLQSLTGASVQSVRTHYWSGVSPSPLPAWEQMDRAGLRSDASLSPQCLGYRGGAMLPIMPSMNWRTDMDGLVALPTAVMDAYVVPRTSGLSKNESSNHMDQLVANAKENDGLVVVDWHVRTLSNIGAWRGFMLPFLKVLPKLANESACRFMTVGEAAEAWRAHAKRCYQGAAFSELEQ